MAARQRGRTGAGVAEGALAVRLWTSASCSRTRVSPSVLRGLEPGALSAPSRPRLSGSVASASALTHWTEGCHRLSCFGKRGFMKFMPRGRWAVSYAESHPGLANTRPGPARPCRPGRGWGAGGSGPPPTLSCSLPAWRGPWAAAATAPRDRADWKDEGCGHRKKKGNVLEPRQNQDAIPGSQRKDFDLETHPLAEMPPVRKPKGKDTSLRPARPPPRCPCG